MSSQEPELPSWPRHDDDGADDDDDYDVDDDEADGYYLGATASC